MTADDNSFASETSSNWTFERTFNSVEEILYHCTVHSSAGRDINSFQNGRINVVSSLDPQVDVDSVSVPDEIYTPDDMIDITTNITNNGTSASGAFSITYYASTDATIDDNDIELGTTPIAGLDASASTEVMASVAAPADILIGDYFIGVVVSLGGNSGATASTVKITGTFFVTAGVNDAWFNLATAGQGMIFTAFPDLVFFFLSWFTYDTERPDESITAILGEPGHRWLTAFGSWDGNVVTLNVELTTGGIFDSVEPMVDQSQDYGTVTITFHHCNSATLVYEIFDPALSGTIELARVAGDNIALCEALILEQQMAQ